MENPPFEERNVVSLRAKNPGLIGIQTMTEKCAHGSIAKWKFTTKGDTLLKLRKVEIVGFKSFCERTVVTFSGTGTTCIVGPNGCGKSNVVDAISWVLGEQSHKSLRAERMSDCIFNGTTKRPPMGLAEVTITMEDPELAEAARFVLEVPRRRARLRRRKSRRIAECTGSKLSSMKPAAPQSQPR